MTGDEYSYTFKFQFHNSTIKTICTLDVSLRLLNFNSIMVQLKLGLQKIDLEVDDEFQFHNGTIKTFKSQS